MPIDPCCRTCKDLAKCEMSWNRPCKFRRGDVDCQEAWAWIECKAAHLCGKYKKKDVKGQMCMFEDHEWKDSSK